MSVRTIAVAAALAASQVACSQPAPYVKPPTPVTVAAVASTTTGTSVRYSGTVKPAVEVGVAFKVGGYVEELLQVRDDRGRDRDVQEGDRVPKGAALARVRASDYDQKLVEAKSGLAEARAMQENAQLDFDRATRLYAARSLTKPEMDGAKAKLDAANAKVAAVGAMVNQAQILVDDIVLRSPIDGVVLSRNIEKGSLAVPGPSAFVLADTSSVKVAFGVPDVVVRTLAIGRPQRIAFDALAGREFDGRITSIAPAPDPASRVYQIEVTLPNAQRDISVGFIASLQLADAPGHTVATVPLDAIVKPPAGQASYAVFIVEGAGDHQVARMKPVTLGDVLGNAIVVTGGVAAGQPVIVRGATLVLDGETVRVLPPDGNS
ncbi:MAG TPA: efflux RND transporter periplasmic adaptor subunit [Vicinamibacterales bacterium]|jgi:RND family efflux transporter MFP subunit|nr:efflux RND transporter periplasmic adaptor subunit [Vicinamibacterales bacterium]